jgi:hypothetical protein
MATFTVHRSTWYRGHFGQQDSSSKLLRPDGQRCCIGFVGQQCGIPDGQLLDRGTVAVCDIDSYMKFPGWMRSELEPSEIENAYNTNDHSQITDAEREEELIEIFARNGDTLVFVD